MGKLPNFVHNDQIWKDHVKTENYSVRVRWPERWGHLTEEYRRMHEIQCGSYSSPSPDTAECEDSHQRSSQVVKLPPIEPAKCLKRVPVTTAQMIGWRSARPDCQLERLGKYSNTVSRQKGSLLKKMNWPREGVE
ncbi:ciliary microtubule inner protein 1-like [Lineus longissimus]|uniref:ciliary microtubule inner protein 1-like n=1 Tax=Lineus longissimus TaxID=88925 RepID=UPI00315D1243